MTATTFDNLARDLRYALRTLRRSPLFTVVALLTLSVGIGATTAVFSVVDSVLLRPLPYPESERLVAISHSAPGATGLPDPSGDLRTSGSMYFTYTEENRVFERVGVWSPGILSVTGLAEPEQVRGIAVGDGTLQALAVPPALGRWLSQADQQPDAAPTIMLSHAYWQRHFGGSPDAIGRTITVNSRSTEIVGVMPEGFRVGDTPADLFLPIPFDRSRLLLPTFDFFAIARLKPGVTIADANADIARMLPIWMESWPPFPGGSASFYADVWQIGPAVRALKQDVIGSVGSALWVVTGTVAIVLLIACANVTNLLLVRAEGRQRELAVRAALGAGAWRIGRVTMFETLLLGLAAGVLGVVIAEGALRLLIAIAPGGLPRLAEIALDARVLGLALAMSLLAGFVPGLVATLKNAGSRISSGLHSGGRGAGQSRESHRTQGILVVTQVALALVLLVSAGLMIRTFQALRTVEPGFTQPQQLQTMRIAIPAPLVPDPELATRMQNAILDALAAIPGAESAAFTSSMPMDGFNVAWNGVAIEGQTPPADGSWPLRRYKYVSPGLLATAGTRLVAGRELTWAEIYDGRLIAVISENFAREVWGTPDAALGKRIAGGGMGLYEIVGVAQDVRDNGPSEPAPSIVYWPTLRPNVDASQPSFATRVVTVVVRSPRAGTDAFLREVQQAVWGVNPNLPVASLRTMRDIHDGSLARTSFTLTMLAAASGVALTLGVIGLYGVLAYAVLRRRREIAIRLALGAQPRDVTRKFVRHGVVLASVGIAIGLGAAAIVTRFMAALLYAVKPFDAATYVAVVMLLTLVAALASWLPARRAAAVDPAEALAAE